MASVPKVVVVFFSYPLKVPIFQKISEQDSYIGEHKILEQGQEVDRVIFVKSGFCKVAPWRQPPSPWARLMGTAKTCWCSVGKVEMNPGVPLKATTRDGLSGSFPHSLQSTSKKKVLHVPFKAINLPKNHRTLEKTSQCGS